MFAVGDAKQSIFSFQRADPAAFLRMREHFAEAPRPRAAIGAMFALDVSFRSTEAVLAAVDAVFARPEANDGVALDGAPIRHRAVARRPAGLVELWPPVGPLDPAAARAVGAAGRAAPDARAAGASRRGRSPRRSPAGNGDGERLAARDRRIEAGDVMVLVRRRGPFVAELVRALKERSVAVAGADRMRLTEQLAIEDMMALMQFLLLPEDDLTLATVLKGPLVGFDEDRLFELAHDRREPRAVGRAAPARGSDHPDFAAAVEFLSGLLGRADFVPPYELLAEVLGRAGGRRRMLARLGPDAADPLDELLAAALAYERRHGPSLQGFLHWLGGRRHRDQARSRSARARRGADHDGAWRQGPAGADRVPARHDASAARPCRSVAWTEDGVPLWRAHEGCGAPALEAARAAAQQRRDAEYRRLLYVAMTRAEDRLYVCGWRTRQAPPPGTWYALVQAGLADGRRRSRPSPSPPVRRRAATAGRGRGCASRRRSGRRRAATTAPAPRVRPCAATAAVEPASRPRPSRSRRGRSRRRGRRARSPRRARRSAPMQGAGFRRGLLVHRLLQALPQLAPEARAAAARRFLARPVHGLDPAQQEALLAETLAVLDDPDRGALFGPQSLAEVPVVGLRRRARDLRPHRPAGGGHRRGPDRRLQDAAARAGRRGRDPAALSRPARAYRDAVATVYPGRTVRCALLWTDGPRLMWVSASRLRGH